MRHSVTKCPDCEGKTSHEHTERIWNDAIKHIRICSDCDLEYTVVYGFSQVENIRRYNESEEQR